MLKQLFYLFIGITIAISGMACEGCQNNGTTPTTEDPVELEKKSTENGFSYTHHIKNEGPKPQVGEYAYYNLEIYGIPESEIPMFFEAGEDFRKIVDPKNHTGYDGRNPMIDILPLLSVGDSVTVYHSPDSIINLSPTYGGLKMLEYKITLTGIALPAQHTENQIAIFNKRKAKLFEARTRLESINGFCQKVLADYKANKIDNLIEKQSGLKFVIHEQGKGKNLRNGNVANFFYSGYMMDGTLFENTFDSGDGTSLQVGRELSLPGWEEVMTYLKIGASVTVFLPAKLAYAEAGNPPIVPPNTDVMFYMEIME